MNKADRKRVADLRNELKAAQSQVVNVGESLREMADAEQEKYDNMGGGLRSGEGGQAIEAAASALDEAASACESGNAGEALEALDQVEV